MWSGWAVGLALAALPCTAHATPGLAESFGYQAPAECPARVDFSEEVATRTKSWLAADSPFTVSVFIEHQQPSGFYGLVTVARGEQRTERRLEANGCDELAQALALIVAILIDPQASSTPLPAESARRPAPVYLLLAPARPSPPPPARLWFSAGPELTLQTAMTRNSAVGERLFLGFSRGDNSLPLSSLRVSFSRLAEQTTSPTSGSRAEFTLLSARADGCIWRVNDGPLAFESCAFIEFGRLRAVGVHRGGNVTRNEPWGSLGLLLRPSWTLARRLVFGGDLGLALPLRHYRFAFTGEPELTRTATFGFEAALGLGLRFP